MTTKFQAFAADYDAICRIHGVHIEWRIDYLAVQNFKSVGVPQSEYLHDETKKEGERDDDSK